MIICEIIGGLGNQLFEYAHARVLSIKLDQELSFDLGFFNRYHRPDVYRLDKFNTNIKIANDYDINRLKRKIRKPDILRRIYRKIGVSPYINAKLHFDNKWFNNNDITLLKSLSDFYVSGYFADEKCFFEVEDIIRKEITLRNKLNIENQKIIKNILNVQAVSIHIRRVDYVNNSFFADIPLSYYYNSIEYINNKITKPVFFIFSDDLNWVKDNLDLKNEFFLVDVNNEKTDYMELMLMAACKHNIIANSTFSWWGAWLNNNPEKFVIAPKVWFQDISVQKNYEKGSFVPKSWIKL